MSESISPFAGGTAVVTGAGSGLGRALAHAFAAQGMHVVVADLALANAEAVARELPRASAFCVDVGDPESISTRCSATARRCARNSPRRGSA